MPLDDFCECVGQRGGVRVARPLHDARGQRELRVPSVERRHGALLQQRVALLEHAHGARQRVEVRRIDAGDAAIEKAPPLLRRAAQDLQPRRRVGEDAHRVQIPRQRHPLLVDHQHAPPRLAALQADGERLLDVVALQHALREDARRVEANDAGEVRRAERFRRGEEVDRLEEVRLPLAVAADDEVRADVERQLLRGEIAEVFDGEASKDHSKC